MIYDLLPMSLILIAAAILAGGLLYFLGQRQRRLAAELTRVHAESASSALKEMQASERVEKTLRDRERKYRSIFENAMIGIAQIVPGGRWTAANPALAKMLGYLDPSEILSAQPDLRGEFFVLSEDRDTWYALLDGEKPGKFEADVWRLDRKQVRLALTGTAVRDEHGTVLYYEAMMMDITDSYRSKRSLEQALTEAQSANHAKSMFLANMSHELRTPLNAIIGFAEIIKGQLFGPIGNTQYSEYSQDIYDSGQHLLSLINDILDMSKIEANQRELHEEIVSLADVAKSVVRFVAHKATEGRVKMVLAIATDLPRVRGEEKALKQILLNMLSNAVKFTPEGGTVTLTVEIVRDGIQAGQLRVAVADTGIGMAPEEIPIALAPFGQIESALSRKYQGTGLGLPITKQLVELHGGTFDIQSAVGQGTTVSFTLPASKIMASLI